MADKNDAGVFRQSAMNRIASSDELDRYIKVASPSAWAVLIAALLLVGAIVVWAVVAIVPVTIETTGVTFDSENYICWVDKDTADKIRNSGAKAHVGGVEAEVTEVSDIPMSSTEVINILGIDFYTKAVDIKDWNYQVTVRPNGQIAGSDFTIEGELGKMHLAPVSLVVMETQPISLIMGKD